MLHNLKPHNVVKLDNILKKYNEAMLYFVDVVYDTFYWNVLSLCYCTAIWSTLLLFLLLCFHGFYITHFTFKWIMFLVRLTSYNFVCTLAACAPSTLGFVLLSLYKWYVNCWDIDKRCALYSEILCSHTIYMYIYMSFWKHTSLLGVPVYFYYV